MDEVEILGFRADERASKGITTAHLDDVIASYNPEAQTAPIVIGHPTNDAPAHGTVSKLRRDGSKLFVGLRQLGQEVVDGVRNGKLVGRSIAFWDPDHPSNPTPGKYSLRHFGFLGAQAPGIPNLGKLAFSADDTTIECEGEPAEAVIFAVAPTQTRIVTESLAPASPVEENTVTDAEKLAADKAAFAAEQAALATERAEFAAQVKSTREAHNAGVADRLVASGHITPADKPALVLAFNAMSPGTLEFAAGDTGNPVDRIATIMGKCGKIVPLGDDGKPITPAGSPPEFSAESGDAKAKADAALKAANERDAAAHKG